MSNIWVTLYWAVPEVVWDQEIVSLTWSASVLNMFWNRILIDIWLFQWGEWSDLYNKENTKFINDLDAVFITHSHIDHIWRLPLLHKLWFRWPIYMTKATKEITYEMLLDCLKIQQWDAIIREKKSKTLVERLERSLKIKSELLAEFKKKRRLDESKQNDLNEIEEYLNFYWVETDSDIEKVLFALKQTLFNNDDINWVMSLIKTVEYNDEVLFDSKKISTHNNNREDQDLLNNLPQEVANWNTQKFEIDRDSEARKLKRLWLKNLLDEVKSLLYDKNLNHKDINWNLSKKLEEAFTFCHYEYPAYNKWKSWSHKDHTDEYEDRFKEYSKLLSFYWIDKRDDISELYIRTKDFIKVLKNKSSDEIAEVWFHNYMNKWIDNTFEILTKVIELFKLSPTFKVDDIYSAYDNLIVLNQKSKNRNSLSITYSDAAHLVGASSVTLTTKLINKKVDNVLKAGPDSVSVFFSWDMWRIKDNRLWRPELPPKPVDYLQIESTYGWRNHRNRQESVNELIDMIDKSEWNVLVSVFSQQRLQEILLTIYEEKQKRGVDFMNYEILVDAPLWQKVTEKYLKFRKDIYEPLNKYFYRFLSEDDWQFLYMDFEAEYCNKTFGTKLSEDQVRTAKDKVIVLSSSWMMDWWAIQNHLSFILSDEKATLLAPWYLSRWTLWNDIIWWDNEFVTVKWVKCEIKCNKKYIDWFSSHIWHDEIIQYLLETLEAGKLNAWATIALTHWNRDWQEILKKEIEEILNSDKFRHLWIIVTLPWIFEEYDVLDRKFKKLDKEEEKREGKTDEQTDKKREVSLEKIVYKKPIVPTVVKKLEEIEEKKTDETVAQVVAEERNRNKKEIVQTKLLGDIISRRKKSFETDYLNKLLESNSSNYLEKIQKNISRLSATQRKEFYDRVDKKLTRTDTIDKQINNIWKKNTKLKLIIDDIIYFFKTEKQEISNKINDLKKSIEQLVIDKNELKSKLYDLENFKWEKDADYKKKLSDLRNKIRSKDKKIKIHENEIKNLKNIIVSTQNDIYRESKSLFSDTNLEWFKEIYNNLLVEFTQDLWNKIIKLWDKNIQENDKKIDALLKEKRVHMSINVKKRKAHFWWRNLYEELYNSTEKEIDLEKLQLLINEWFFNTQELSYINSKLSIIKSSDWEKRNKAWSMNHLISYFKEKRNENRDKWINFTFYIEDLNKKCLSLLSKIFEKEEFNNEIKDKFDIYLFLNSKMTFKDYIATKFNVQKLSWIKEHLDKFDAEQDNIDYVSRVLDLLDSKNNSTNNLSELKDLNYWIVITRYEVEDILGIKRDR